MKICLGKPTEPETEVKKKNDSEKELTKNRDSKAVADNDTETDEYDIYFNSNTVKNIKIGPNTVNRVYLNNSIVYELEDTIIASKFHALVPAATATSIIFDKLENQDITSYNLVGYCDVNNHIAVYNNNTEYLVFNIRNAINYAPPSLNSFFYNYDKLGTCIFNNFATDNVTNMAYMFYNCSSLKSLDLSSFKTHNLLSMNAMFSTCRFKSLNLSSFDTANVITMAGLFYFCSSLIDVDLSSFNTENVQNMESMFCYDHKLVTIVSNTFNTSALKKSNDMFLACNLLVGGNGTTFSNSHTNAEYARIDGANGLPGYFTAPANK